LIDNRFTATLTTENEAKEIRNFSWYYALASLQLHTSSRRPKKLANFQDTMKLENKSMLFQKKIKIKA